MINIFSYDEYLKTKKALSFEEMQALHREITEEIGSDAEAMELFDELIRTATRYSRYRADWLLLDNNQKMDIDSSRTACHDSVITHVNMLARYLKSLGKEAKWRDTLGYEEEDPYNRKRIGDFACYLVFVNSLNAR